MLKSLTPPTPINSASNNTNNIMPYSRRRLVLNLNFKWLNSDNLLKVNLLYFHDNLFLI